jgi:chaperonin cofactor prefoldin
LEKEREEEDRAEEEVNGLKHQVEILEMKVTSVDDQNSQTRAHLEDLRRGAHSLPSRQA